MDGAPRETRTPTPVRATDFESAASTDSATGARNTASIAPVRRGATADPKGIKLRAGGKKGCSPSGSDRHQRRGAPMPRRTATGACRRPSGWWRRCGPTARIGAPVAGGRCAGPRPGSSGAGWRRMSTAGPAAACAVPAGSRVILAGFVPGPSARRIGGIPPPLPGRPVPPAAAGTAGFSWPADAGTPVCRAGTRPPSAARPRRLRRPIPPVPTVPPAGRPRCGSADGAG